MEENKREKGTKEFLGWYLLNGVAGEGFTEKVVFFLKPFGHALFAEIIALCVLFTKNSKHLLLRPI